MFFIGCYSPHMQKTRCRPFPHLFLHISPDYPKANSRSEAAAGNLLQACGWLRHWAHPGSWSYERYWNKNMSIATRCTANLALHCVLSHTHPQPGFPTRLSIYDASYIPLCVFFCYYLVRKATYVRTYPLFFLTETNPQLSQGAIHTSQFNRWRSVGVLKGSWWCACLCDSGWEIYNWFYWFFQIVWVKHKKRSYDGTPRSSAVTVKVSEHKTLSTVSIETCTKLHAICQSI